MERVAVRDKAGEGRLFALMLGVFMGGGLLASIEALLVPRLILTLHVDYARALLVQLVYYAGYLLLAWPATWATARWGVLRAVAGGLATMAAGAFALAGAQAAASFGALLTALLLLSSGVTVLQIACNGAVATRGDRARAASRFTLLQGFNALGTVIGPLIGAWCLLGGRGGIVPLLPFLGFGLAFAALAIGFAANGALLDEPAAPPSLARIGALLAQRAVRWGAIAIFFYVGAEVTLGTLAANLLMLPDRLAASPVTAGRLVSLYWAGAMIGRFAGAFALRRIAPRRLLAAASAAAIMLALVAALGHGAVASAALLAIGLCNSIMFPTIFGLAMPARSADVPAASMLMCIAVVGGAIVPMATGLVADRAGLPSALLLPAACYGVILLFARVSAA